MRIPIEKVHQTTGTVCVCEVHVNTQGCGNITLLRQNVGTASAAQENQNGGQH